MLRHNRIMVPHGPQTHMNGREESGPFVAPCNWHLRNSRITHSHALYRSRPTLCGRLIYALTTPCAPTELRFALNELACVKWSCPDGSLERRFDLEAQAPIDLASPTLK